MVSHYDFYPKQVLPSPQLYRLEDVVGLDDRGSLVVRRDRDQEDLVIPMGWKDQIEQQRQQQQSSSSSGVKALADSVTNTVTSTVTGVTNKVTGGGGEGNKLQMRLLRRLPRRLLVGEVRRKCEENCGCGRL
jgi:hypothetical protein